MRGTTMRLCLAAGLVAATMWPGAALGASTVTGTVTFDGKVPTLKPLAMDAPQAAAMMQVAADSGVILAEAFRLRHQPIHHRAIEIIRSGQIGEVRHVRNAMMSVTAPEDRDALFRQAAEENGRSSTSVLRVAQDQSALAGKLQGSVDQFLLNVRAM